MADRTAPFHARRPFPSSTERDLQFAPTHPCAASPPSSSKTPPPPPSFHGDLHRQSSTILSCPSPPRGIKGEGEPLPPRTSLLLSSSRTEQPPPEAQSTIGALSASRGGPSHPLSPPLQLQIRPPPSLIVAGKHTPAIPSPLSLSVFYLTFILIPLEGHRFGTTRNLVNLSLATLPITP
jgi:hypothetical protein